MLKFVNESNSHTGLSGKHPETMIPETTGNKEFGIDRGHEAV